MTKNGNFLNKVKELKIKTPEEIGIEKQLLPRLRFMGLLLFFFSGCALCYSIFFASGVPFDADQKFATDGMGTPEEMEYTSGLSLPSNPSYGFFQVERYNGYIVALSFALVGAACFLTAWSKQKKLPTTPEGK